MISILRVKTLCTLAVMLIILIPQTEAKWTPTGLFGGSWYSYTTNDSMIYIAGIKTMFKKRIYSSDDWTSIDRQSQHLATMGKLILAADDSLKISADEGQTWQSLPAPQGSMDQLITLDGRIFVQSGIDIFVSSDTGHTFTYLRHDLYKMKAVNGKIYGITGTDSIIVSTDYGVTWNSFTGNLPVVSIFDFSVSDSFIFVGTNYGVYKSGIQNPIYTQYNSGFGNDTTIQRIISAGNSVFAIDYQSNLFIAPVSTMQWARQDSVNFSSFLFNVNDTVYFTARGNALCKTYADTINWISDSRGLNNISPLVFAVSGQLTYFAYENGLYVSKDTNDNYIPISNGILDSNYLSTIDVDGSVVYVTGARGVYQSNDTGATWVSINNGLSNGFHQFSSLEFTTDSLYLFDYSNSTCYSTAKNNINWHVIADQTMQLQIGDLLVYHDTLLAFSTTNVYRYDHGNWINLFPPITNGVCAYTVVDGTLFIVDYTHGLFKTNLNNIQWQQLQLNGIPFVDFASLIGIGKNLLFGVKGHVFISTDKGVNWAPFGDDHYLPSQILPFFQANPTCPFVYCSAFGLYRTDASHLWINVPEVAAKDLSLLLYPNPTQNHVTIKLPQPERIEHFKIYDLTGRLIKDITNPACTLDLRIPAGNYLTEAVANHKVYKGQLIIQ